MLKSKSLFLILLVIVSSVFYLGCKKKEGPEKTTITVKGSDTMVNLSQRWAEVYMQQNPNISIQVTGGGSGTGVAALLNSTTHIANSSRELKKDEWEKAKTQGMEPMVYEVALDGLALIVHPSNKVESLTMEQIRKIFTGEIKNWKEVGGDNLPITLYGRENSSGTYEFFKEHVLGKDDAGKQRDYATSTQVLQGTAALGEAVARDVKGIAYGGVGYFAERTDVKIISVKKDAETDGIYPAHNGKVNYDAIWSGDYSISRYLYCFTQSNPSKEVVTFLDFIVSPEGQKLVGQMEYIPLPSKTN